MAQDQIEKFEKLLRVFAPDAMACESLEDLYIETRDALTDMYREALEANVPQWHWVEDGEELEPDRPIWVMCMNPDGSPFFVKDKHSRLYFNTESTFTVAWMYADVPCPAVIPVREVSK